MASSSNSYIVDFFIGGISGVISKTICAPIERVKLLMQTSHTNLKLIGNEYKSIYDCFYRCIKEEGFLSLWRGNMVINKLILLILPIKLFHFIK
jgi:solute carrier family 25 (adenine nucleotide translocator) protein 4/5/6/31